MNQCDPFQSQFTVKQNHACDWLVVTVTYASEKYESQLGLWHSQYMESHKNHVPNRQSNDIWILQLTTIWIWAWIKRRTHMNTLKFLHVSYWTEPPASFFSPHFKKITREKTHPTRLCTVHLVSPILLQIQSTKKKQPLTPNWETPTKIKLQQSA